MIRGVVMAMNKKRKSNRAKGRTMALNASRQSIAPSTDLPQSLSQEAAPAALVGEHLPSDNQLLDRTRMQWQLGAWQALAGLDAATFEHHREHAQLYLFKGVAQAQQGDLDGAKTSILQAVESGVNRRLLAQALISGVYNTLGRAAALSGRTERAAHDFHQAINIAAPGCASQASVELRLRQEAESLDLKVENSFIENARGTFDTLPRVSVKRVSALEKLVADATGKIKNDIKSEIAAESKKNTPNPYSHNRTLTPELNKSLRDFSEKKLNRPPLKPAYIDYLATKSIQIEKNCVGRLATTVQDAIARQLVAESVEGSTMLILEIGALYGVSLAILYNHVVTRFESAKVICLDPFDGYYGKALDAVLNNPVDEMTFKRNMQLSNVPQCDFDVIKSYSTDPIAIQSAKDLDIDLLIIDGDHSYEGVKFDFDHYFPSVKPGGYVIFDDYNAKEWPGVQKFVDNDLASIKNLEFIGSISRTAVARKIGDAE